MGDMTTIPVPGTQSVIFPAELVPWYLVPESVPWTPSTEQVLVAERGLQAFLATATMEYRPGAPQRIAARLHHYARQYFGVSAAGRRLLYINCFPANSFSDWRTKEVYVDDGGEAFFQLLYDPESGEFSGLSVNGVA